ncbi:hypothetical protein BHYA_0147g00110 [Botrytis hyacinthi]|uniref:Chromo domain-containing protein n=1 Tax=Botrytis hyacinthi TaxID=278943 RepID=A0A4Z1GFQ4_9HELO|nr:hypothetical protein BHYA_0147g00110 [Botrytis hyacinthi]
MARLSAVADSDESETNSVESLDPRNSREPTTKPNRNPVSALAHQSGESVQDSIERNDNLDEDGDEIAMDGDAPEEEAEDADDADEDADNTIVVMVPGPRNPEEYVPYQDDTVYSVLEEINGSDGETLYRVEYEDERQENLSKDAVIPPYYQIVLSTFTKMFGFFNIYAQFKWPSHPEAFTLFLKEEGQIKWPNFCHKFCYTTFYPLHS